MSPPGRRAVLAAGLAGAGLAFAGPGAAQASADARFRALLDRLARDPPGDETAAGAAQRRRASSQRLAELAAFDPGTLSGDGRIVHAAVLHGLRLEAATHQLFPFGAVGGGSPYVVHPRRGAHQRLPALLDAPVVSAERLDAVARDLDGESERLRADAAAGVRPPVFLIDRTTAQLTALAARAGAAAGGGRVTAALQRQAATLMALRPEAPAEPGVWRLKDGDAWYSLALAAGAGAAVSPEAAQREALAQARGLQDRADRLLRGQGLRRGPVGARLRALSRNPRWLYPTDAAGKARAVADMNAALAAVRPRLAAAFGDLAIPAAEVRRLTDAEEAAGRQGYRAEQADGGPALYFVDLSGLGRRPRWTLPSVAHHELLPGHGLQTAQANPPHPLPARFAPGYPEGWAIYAERLSDELGAFEDDPLGELGYLQWMLFRVGRLIADLGIHRLRWSRSRAIAELRALQGFDVAFVSIEEDVDRLCMQPGAAGGQWLCAAGILRLREEARGRLGGRFALSGFHAAVLGRGPMAIPGLQRAIDLWASGERRP